MRYIIAVFVTGLVLACGGGGSTSPGGGGGGGGGGGNGVDTVSAVGETSWNPSTVTIQVGQTLSFRNNTNIGHNVTFDNVAGHPANVPTWNSGFRDLKFNNAGTFPYHCSIHPPMTGSVTVQ